MSSTLSALIALAVVYAVTVFLYEYECHKLRTKIAKLKENNKKEK